MIDINLNVVMNCRVSVLLLVMLLSPLYVWPTDIRGVVVDGKTDSPLQGAYVYLDGTSFMTLTDSKGSFRIHVPENINTVFSIRHMGYEQISFQLGVDSIPQVIKMQEKTYVLGEVVVLPFSRIELLGFFHKNFFGTTSAAYHCIINNPDVLKFRFEKENGGLSVTTGDELMHVTNKYLGYDVYFMINDKYFGLKKKMDIFSEVTYRYGDYESIFVDISEGKRKFKRRRYNSYKVSQMAFWRSVSSEPLKESEFIVKRSRNGASIKNNEELGWTITDTLGMTKVKIDFPPRRSGVHPYAPNYSQKLYYDHIWVAHVSVENQPVSIRIFEREFYIDKYGTYIFPGKRFRYRGMSTALGYWNTLQNAHALPKDYVPEK